MSKKVMIAVITAIVIAGLVAAAHMVDFIGIAKRIHGG